MNKIKAHIKSVPRYVWILALIVLVGIFFRTYNFHEWLVFNPDQARDAMLIESVLEKETDFPLLGPEAGNTRFQLGPIFYWFEIAAAKIFGNNPAVLAFPDVFFSILTLIVFYFFSRKFFSEKMSLSLTAVLSLSFFAVRYSRFAMNTNSIPFWTLLFLLGILNILDEKNRKNIVWPMITGIALGVGIQLHALLLIAMPIMSLFVLVLLIKRKLFNWKSLVIILFFCFALNIGEIIFDIKNNGANSNLFISSISKESENSNISRNLGMNIMYQFQANMHMLSSLGNQNDPVFIKMINRMEKNKTPYVNLRSKIVPILGIALSAIFTVIGYFLLGYFWQKEKDCKKKDFLMMTAIYSVIIFLVMLPIIQEASIRYFIVLMFIPFIFLGLWLHFFITKKKNIGIAISVIAIAILMFSNLISLVNAAKAYQEKRVSNVENSVLGEDEMMLNYIIKNMPENSSEAYLIGKRLYAIRFYKPLAYLAEKRGIKLMRVFSEKEIQPGIPVFYVKDSETKERTAGEIYKNHVIKNSQKFNDVVMFNFEN